MASLTELRTRRAALGAILGGVAATVASALGRPDIARAGQDGDVVLGAANLASTETRITNSTNNEDVVVGVSDQGGVGVNGSSSTFVGVAGNSTSHVGVAGGSTATDHPAVLGWSTGNATGVQGYSGTGNPPTVPANTGVYGEADQDGTARGVHGKTTVGRGVFGEATSGSGVRGYAGSGVGVYAASGSTGFALQASGRVKLNRSGQASVGAGQTYVDVTVPGGLAGTTLPFATLLRYHSGVYVAAIRPNYPTAGIMRIYLNQAASATTSTPVSWLVLG
jgi:hypothetical protein